MPGRKTARGRVGKGGLTPLGALRVLDPDEWARQVRKAMADADGAVAMAAYVLDVSPRTLFRWLSEPELADVPRRPPGRPW